MDTMWWKEYNQVKSRNIINLFEPTKGLDKNSKYKEIKSAHERTNCSQVADLEISLRKQEVKKIGAEVICKHGEHAHMCHKKCDNSCSFNSLNMRTPSSWLAMHGNPSLALMSVVPVATAGAERASSSGTGALLMCFLSPYPLAVHSS